MCRSIVRSGGLFVLIGTLNKFPINVRIQDAIACTVGNIAKSGDDTIESIKAAGLVPAILGILRRLSGNYILVHYIILSLRFMADSNEDIKKQIVSLGGIKLLASIQKKCEDDDAIADAGLLLHCLKDSENQENRDATESSLKKQTY